MRASLLMVLAATSFFIVAPGDASANQSAPEAVQEVATPSELAMQSAARGDIDGALNILTSAATSGDFDTQVMLAAQYAGAADALLVAADFPTARNWMQKAAAQKDKAVAAKLEQQILNFAIAFRDGVLPRADAVILYDETQAKEQREKNPKEWLRWLEIAAQFGNVDVMREVGSAYAQGKGVATNQAVAARWYEKIADHDPAAELWLGKYNIQEQNLREAMYWLDRYYLDEENKQSHDTEYDKALHYFYALLLPQTVAGATPTGMNHQTTREPVKAAHLASDDTLYPIVFIRQYRHDATGKDFVLRVQLNNYRMAELMKKNVEKIKQYGKDAHIKINGRDGYVTKDSKSGAELVVMDPFETHIVLSAEMLDSVGGEAGDIAILKAALRATDFDNLIATANGHGYYKKDKSGNLYKLK